MHIVSLDKQNSLLETHKTKPDLSLNVPLSAQCYRLCAINISSDTDHVMVLIKVSVNEQISLEKEKLN